LNLLMMTALLSASSGVVRAEEPAACEAPIAVPGAFQVAWISPVNKRARNRSQLQVVRVGDLRAWVNQNGADQSRLLQGMGYVGPVGGRKAKKDWKVTIFDVQSEQLCRPVADAEAGADLLGAPVCSDDITRRLDRWETDCGYTLDRAEEDWARGLDTFRISWEQAASQGFCVMPLDRFLDGA